MKAYRVHIYAVARVPVTVEADTQRGAVKKANQEVDLDRLFYPVGECEYAEEITGYLVDEVGDTEYKRSMWYDREGEPDTELGADISYDLHTQMSEGNQ